ncbi:MAG: hypothetical protein MI923_19335 [Phycisphaerales bacterium]|nr:hypothetical protein [Phycisphaerales bacterium]
MDDAKRWSQHIVMILILTIVGCQKPAAPEGTTAGLIGNDDDNLGELWNQTLSVLRKFDFEPDRQDRVRGIITAMPATSMQWHEPWRQDVADGYGLLHSSMHTTQRKAEVRFVRNDRWSVEVQIDVYRLSRPETQITSASSTLHGFSEHLPTLEGQSSRSGKSGAHWVYLGRDGAMEQRLLRRILARALPPA